MSPTTTRCIYCGEPLEPLIVRILGAERIVGLKECSCAGAKAENEARRNSSAEEERAEADRRLLNAVRRAGVMPRYERAEHPLAAECARDVMDGRNVYIHGDVGTLKTHLASAITRNVIEAGYKAKFTAAWKILDEIKAGFHNGNDPLPKYQNTGVLVLDDFGKESPTDFALERLFALIDERSAMMLPTVITTQYKPGLLIDRLSKNGDRDTAVAIVSRLRQDCRVVELTGKDRRLS